MKRGRREQHFSLLRRPLRRVRSDASAVALQSEGEGRTVVGLFQGELEELRGDVHSCLADSRFPDRLNLSA